MNAQAHNRYGPPDVVRLEDTDKPVPGAGEILIRVRASTVNTADWRLRASAFPGGLWLPGRLMTGLFRPRNRVLGAEVAGEVAALGDDVKGFSLGQRVFGFVGHGAHAEYVLAKADGAIVPIPDELSFQEAAALPFGGLSALVFLRDFGAVKAGQKVLVVGASGNVGVYGVQIAKALGAEVTGVASSGNLDLVRSLGADHVVDYTQDDVTQSNARFDLIFDTVGALSFARARKILTGDGTFLPLNFGLGDVPRALVPRWLRRQRFVLNVNPDRREDLETLVQMIQTKKLRPVIDTVYPFEDIQAAYVHVEGRRRKGSIVLDVA